MNIIHKVNFHCPKCNKSISTNVCADEPIEPDDQLKKEIHEFVADQHITYDHLECHNFKKHIEASQIGAVKWDGEKLYDICEDCARELGPGNNL